MSDKKGSVSDSLDEILGPELTAKLAIPKTGTSASSKTSSSTTSPTNTNSRAPLPPPSSKVPLPPLPPPPQNSNLASPPSTSSLSSSTSPGFLATSSDFSSAPMPPSPQLGTSPFAAPKPPQSKATATANPVANRPLASFDFTAAPSSASSLTKTPENIGKEKAIDQSADDTKTGSESASEPTLTSIVHPQSSSDNSKSESISPTESSSANVEATALGDNSEAAELHNDSENAFDANSPSAYTDAAFDGIDQAASVESFSSPNAGAKLSKLTLDWRLLVIAAEALLILFLLIIVIINANSSVTDKKQNLQAASVWRGFVAKNEQLICGPDKAYAIIGTVEKGAVVERIAIKGDYSLVHDNAGRVGYIRSSALSSIAPAITADLPFTQCQRFPLESDISNCEQRSREQFEACNAGCQNETCTSKCSARLAECREKCTQAVISTKPGLSDNTDKSSETSANVIPLEEPDDSKAETGMALKFKKKKGKKKVGHKRRVKKRKPH
ncbi:MAG: hypothetical protein JW841_12555 [Deltaproteobacteria bacterium]|nr:hypothetical protein [Deltaproteobacteria bacterium]